MADLSGGFLSIPLLRTTWGIRLIKDWQIEVVAPFVLPALSSRLPSLPLSFIHLRATMVQVKCMVSSFPSISQTAINYNHVNQIRGTMRTTTSYIREVVQKPHKPHAASRGFWALCKAAGSIFIF
jgi:hypothetical protein